MAIKPPTAARRPLTRVLHGTTLTDDYAWLRDDNWRAVLQDPAALAAGVREHLEAENAYALDWLADTRALQEELVKELRGRIKEDDSSVPLNDGPYAYAMRYDEGAQYPLFVRMNRDGGDPRVLLDCNLLAEGKPFFELGDAGHSPDHRLIVYGADDKGSEYFTLKIRDAGTLRDLADVIEETAGDAEWANDSRTIFYTVLDDNHRPVRVMRHGIGTAPEADAVVYEEADSGFFLGIDKTLTGRFIIIDSHDHETGEIRLIDADHPDRPPVLLLEREAGHEYDIADDGGETLYIRSNADGAEDFRIVAAPLATPGRAYWRDVVPHVPGRLILAMAVLRGRLVWLERVEGLPRIVIRDLASGDEHAIAFAEEAYALGFSTGYEFDTDEIRFTYSSPTTPGETYDYNMASRTRVLRKRQEIPSGHDPERYVARRIFAPAADGETVPISLLQLKETPLDGSAPLLLYGYGAYGITIPAAFSTQVLSLVDRGFIYATAHIRGGKDKGYRWYRDGKRAKKTNSFDDFIAAADFLVKERYSAPGRILAMGGSAGGMLMGAVANRAPEGLFGGIIAMVPFVDVLNTMLDDTLPLTPPEWPEWGNPIESAEDFATILAYSPYDRVEARAYPPILAMAGLTDPRVTYWEPAKWVARLRERSTSGAPVLLRIDMDSGHGGASGRFKALEEVAERFAFALKVMERIKSH